ncbi:MAG: helix-turn-helix domain-containing protein [Candidatus Ranarchaeia archaeon]
MSEGQVRLHRRFDPNMQKHDVNNGYKSKRTNSNQDCFNSTAGSKPMLIRGVWIIDQSGLCLFQRSYGVPFIDKDQFAGMFTALFHFSTEIMNQDHRSQEIKHLEQFKWDKYYFTVHAHKGFNFVVCTEGPGSPSQELFSEIEDAFFKIFKDQLILLGDLLKNTGPTLKEKKKLSALIDQIVRIDAQEKIPRRTVSLEDIYRQKGQVHLLTKQKDAVESIAVLLHSSGKATMKEIAELTGLPEQRVKKTLHKLNKAGLVKFELYHDEALRNGVRL